MNLKEWQDGDGMFHLHKNPRLDESENSPLFTAQINLFKYTSPNFYYACTYEKDGQLRFRANRLSGSPHFSKDNMLGIYSLCITGQYYDLFNKLPIASWYQPKIEHRGSLWNKFCKKVFRKYLWLHPVDICFNLLIKEKLCLGSPLYVLVLFLASLHSFARSKEQTSGKLLWLVRLRTLRRVYTSRIAQIILKYWELSGLKLSDQSWTDISRIYFKDSEHPLHELIGRE